MRIVVAVEGTFPGTQRNEPEQEAPVLRVERPYSWLEDYLEQLDGKEARSECYAWLEQVPGG